MDKKHNKIVGGRVKELLKDNGLTYAEAAEFLGYSDPNMISMIVSGNRSLTREKARILKKHFPSVRLEWLLGYDDFKTEVDESEYYRKQGEREQVAFDEFFRKVVEQTGYDFEFKRIALEDFLHGDQQYFFTDKSTGACTSLGFFDDVTAYGDRVDGIQSFWYDVIDYAAFRLKRIIEKKQQAIRWNISLTDVKNDKEGGNDGEH